jgi:hypothetical protein
MVIDDPGLQTEQVRELILTGEPERLKGLMEIEAGLSKDQTFRHGKRTNFTLFGPIGHGVSICRRVHNGSLLTLPSYRDSTGHTTMPNVVLHLSTTPALPAPSSPSPQGRPLYSPDRRDAG